MDPSFEVAGNSGLVVIEDACQAHGAEYSRKKRNRWRKAGSMGTRGRIQLLSGQKPGACGEGAPLQQDEKVAKKSKVLRDHRQSQNITMRSKVITAAGCHSSGNLEREASSSGRWNRRRQDAAEDTTTAFRLWKTSLFPSSPNGHARFYHLYVIRVFDREGLQKYLAEAKIYPAFTIPSRLHCSTLQALGYKEGEFPGSEKAASEILAASYVSPTRARETKPESFRHFGVPVTKLECAGAQLRSPGKNHSEAKMPARLQPASAGQRNSNLWEIGRRESEDRSDAPV